MMMRFIDCILIFASNYSQCLDVLFRSSQSSHLHYTDLAVCNGPHFGNYCDYVQNTNKFDYNYLDQMLHFSCVLGSEECHSNQSKWRLMIRKKLFSATLTLLVRCRIVNNIGFITQQNLLKSSDGRNISSSLWCYWFQFLSEYSFGGKDKIVMLSIWWAEEIWGHCPWRCHWSPGKYS